MYEDVCSVAVSNAVINAELKFIALDARNAENLRDDRTIIFQIVYL